ncbi:hypothetical protein QQF64_029881 [Cirrhinus molitorella]|uniref:Uncharacterized protein n=1 Tax=Cirrhinus molitorella TaxID=172907 RepID=A0ABR3N237_9TELE
MWQDLRHITDFLQRSSTITDNHKELPDKLNEFYVRFDTLNTNQRSVILPAEEAQSSSLIVTLTEVLRVLSRTNPRKTAGPDNIPGHALRVCSSELAEVFTDIFNLSLSYLCLRVLRPPLG